MQMVLYNVLLSKTRCQSIKSGVPRLPTGQTSSEEVQIFLDNGKVILRVYVKMTVRMQSDGIKSQYKKETIEMKHLLSIIMITLVIAGSAHAADVGVSVSVGQPGFYGRIDIGNFPQPELIYPQPVVIASPHAAIVERPVYLHVPPGHEKKWRKHCHKYNACGRPVYFVRDRWYNDVYVPHHQHARGEHYGKVKGEKHGKGHGKGHNGHGGGHGRD